MSHFTAFMCVFGGALVPLFSGLGSLGVALGQIGGAGVALGIHWLANRERQS